MSLVWFKAVGFCYTIDVGPALGLLLDILCHGDPSALSLKDQSLHMLLQIIIWVDVGVGQLITLVLGLGSYRVRQSASSLGSSPPE